MKRKYYKVESKQGYAHVYASYSCTSRKGSKANLNCAYDELTKHYGKHLPQTREQFIEDYEKCFVIYRSE